jgi:NAD(P)-dependent dehydrogenase (short-subunit alcohol dehydrogenase family)
MASSTTVPAENGHRRPLQGRVALVTGGGRGIGRAISLQLGGAGAAVAVNYARDAAAAQHTVAELTAAGSTAIAVQASVDDPSQNEEMVARVSAQLGAVSILVNNGGIASRGLPVSDTPVEEFERLLRVHAIGPAVLCRLILPAMRAQGRGDIVMMSSAATHLLMANGAPYNMAKAALEALAWTLAKEETSHGIHVNIVAPGLVASEMGDRLAKAVTRGSVSQADELDATSPFGHVCRPEEVADLVSFLVSDRAGYLTGQRIIIDGGASPHRA